MKPTATSRADLLRCMGQGMALDAAAVALGYVRVREDLPVPLPEMPPDLPVTRASAPPEEDAPVPEIQFPTERPRLTFLMPVRVESLAPPQPRRERGHPISDADLAVNWSAKGPPLPPLTHWARLAPFLRQRLGCVIPGTALDQRRLMREVGKGLPLAVLPRRPRQSWAAQAVVLWDATAEMHPFQRDALDLLRRLRRERGPHGLDVRLMRRLPRRADAAHIPQGVPVIALSAMGQFQRSAAVQEAWLALARRLGFLGQSFHALNPCPRDRWQPQIATHWPSSVWDRRPRLPRRGGLRALQTEGSPTDSENPQIGFAGFDGSAQKSIGGFSESVGVHSSVERLLTLLSPASRIEAPLLRTARLALGHAADAGTEWDAWHHAQCWHSLDCFGFRTDEDCREFYQARLQRLRQLSGAEAEIASRIAALMRDHHAGCSSVIAAEAALRAILGVQKETPQEMGTPQRPESEGSSLRRSDLCGLKSLLQSVVDRLRLLAADPGGEEGRQSGLPGWFPGMVERLSAEMRADVEVSQHIAEGLAYAHACLETAHTELPPGVDGEVFKLAKAEVAEQLGEACYFRVALVEGGWQLAEKTLPSNPLSKIVGGIIGSNRTFHLSFADGRQHSFHLASTASPLALPPLRSPSRLILESNLERVHFEARERPKWAKRMWCEHKSLKVEVEVGASLHVLTWRNEEIEGRLLDGNNVPLEDGSGKPFTISTPTERFIWQAHSAPKWATRLWADDHGLAAEFRIKDVPFVLRWIPPGSFLMGSLEDEPGRRENEGPQHRVTISKGYWMAETPVTQAQWRAVVEATGRWQRSGTAYALNPAPSHFKGSLELPVDSVRWVDSVIFCRLLDALMPDGPGFHLPTEAQWELACRAGTEPKAPFNGPIRLEGEVLSPDLEDYAWYGGNSGKDCVVSNPQDSSSWLGQEHSSPAAGTHPVKTKLPNTHGFYDMLGNVWEWCADAWDEEAYSKRADGAKDPRLDSTDDSALRVVRGGSWGYRARACRAAYRYGVHSGFRWFHQGLRLAAGQKPDTREAGPKRKEQPSSRKLEPVLFAYEPEDLLDH
ncbi:MAG: SUMF1/EgtB/PvdO family nonheme iron enzyme [Prosthecobacter sp.]|nr:SUMF1/EgtB/PvdO family nonheme iron enzyme [Prosthecobacter sp.]